MHPQHNHNAGPPPGMYSAPISNYSSQPHDYTSPAPMYPPHPMYNAPNQSTPFNQYHTQSPKYPPMQPQQPQMQSPPQPSAVDGGANSAINFREGDECAICCEPYHQPVSIQPCRHSFCNRCIRLCVCCPLCRGNILSKIPTGRVINPPPTQPISDDTLESWYSYNFTKQEFDAIYKEFKQLDTNSTGVLGRAGVARLIQNVSESCTPLRDNEIDLLFDMQPGCTGVRLPMLMSWVSFNRPAMLDEHHRRALRDLRRRNREGSNQAASSSSPRATVTVINDPITQPPQPLDNEISSAPSVADLLNQYKLPSEYSSSSYYY